MVVMDFERQWFDLVGLVTVPSNNTLVRTPRYRSGNGQSHQDATSFLWNMEGFGGCALPTSGFSQWLLTCRRWQTGFLVPIISPTPSLPMAMPHVGS